MAATPGRRVGSRTGTYTVVGLFALLASFPFLWAVVTMFKADPDLYTAGNNPFVYNRPPTLQHLRLLFQQTPYLTFVRNTVFIGVLVVLITLAFSLPAAYAIARLTGRWGGRLGVAIFLVYLVPPTLLFIPLSRMVASLRLQDSIWSLVLVYPTFTIPLSTWLLNGFFKSVPRDIEEQAQVDGYSRLQAVTRTVLPLVLPGIFTVVVFAFTLSMHEFIYALAFVASSSRMTISVGVPTNLVRGDVFFWQSLMASAVIVAVPVALAYNFFLDRFVQGFTMGAVKG
ncbi:MAG TPA: carbohydrate ABC transporter permease [Actinomycetes bacterium]|nr:carbohydrate ABC transporter permease [Actinomycetes bacterium]